MALVRIKPNINRFLKSDAFIPDKAGSPGVNALRDQWTWKTSLVAYTLSALGVTLLFNRPTKPAGICLIVSSFTWMVYHRLTLPWSFHGYADEALKKDLRNDILLRHYCLEPVPNSQEYRPMGLPSFFVATVDGELVGFVGFGMVMFFAHMYDMGSMLLKI